MHRSDLPRGSFKQLPRMLRAPALVALAGFLVAAAFLLVVAKLPAASANPRSHPREAMPQWMKVAVGDDH